MKEDICVIETTSAVAKSKPAKNKACTGYDAPQNRRGQGFEFLRVDGILWCDLSNESH